MVYGIYNYSIHGGYVHQLVAFGEFPMSDAIE